MLALTAKYTIIIASLKNTYDDYLIGTRRKYCEYNHQDEHAGLNRKVYEYIRQAKIKPFELLQQLQRS